MMKHFTAVCLMLFVSLSVSAQDNRLFPIPTIPDENMNLTERCNYIVYNFWRECPVKQSFSSLDRLNTVFGQWAGLMPYATADTVHLAIDGYLATVDRQAPKNMDEVGNMARNWFYCDTAPYYSEEIYLPFCRAAANGRKLSNAEKARFRSELMILENSAIGAKAPDFAFVTPDGESTDFGKVLASRVVLFFNDPDCADCSLARVRLAADYNTNKMIESGLIKIVSIYPGEPTDEWRAQAATYPESWIVGAAPDADTYFSMDSMPMIYYLDGRHKILGKNVPLDNLLYLLMQMNMQMQPQN